MGSASSLAGKVIEQEDEFGDETGVSKKIPDECPPRKILSSSLRSAGSFGKKKSRIISTRAKPVTKSSSLRSALSFELETEAEKIRRDYEVFRISKQTEIAELQVKTEKMHSENQRFRGEIKALQSTCLKLKNERSMALDGKEQALQRAAAIEKERDKVQRQFKIFRETKEREIQDLLQAKRELESQLQVYMTMGSCTDNRAEVLGNMTTEWLASSLESEPSVDSLTQITSFRGPEFFYSPVERDGPFTNISRDDWNAVAPSVLQLLSSSLQAPVQEPVVRVYLSAPSGMQQEVNLLKQLYFPKLELLCEKQGKFLVVVHFDQTEEVMDDEEFAVRVRMRSEQIKESKVFIAFLGGKSDRFTYEEYNQAHLSRQGKCHAIFCFKDPDWDSNPSLNDENIHVAELLKTEVRRTQNVKLYDNYKTGEKGAEMAYKELKQFLLKELSISDDSSLQWSSSLSSDCLWDTADDWEQVEALKAATESSSEIGLSKCYSDLNEHVSSSGPLPPMVVIGQAGAGKSFLLAKWIALQQSSLSGRLVLYHFVGPTSSSSSASPVLMLKRFTMQLKKQLMSSSMVPCDPAQLEEEFPRWLEKVASKLHGGVTLVIDSADKLQGAPHHMQWLLDPLPVSARVILSVTEHSCPLAWRSWPCLRLKALDFKGSVEMMVSCMSCYQVNITQEQVDKMLYNSSSDGIYNPRFISIVASQMIGCKDGKTLFNYCSLCLSKKNTIDLLGLILSEIDKQWRHSSRNLRQILLHIMLSRNGVNESELLQLVPLKWSEWVPLSEALHQRQIIITRLGLIQLANEQVKEAVNETFSFHEDVQEVREAKESFLHFFENKLRTGHVSWRVTDELPWSLKVASKKTTLEECLLNADVFRVMFERGRISELIKYWYYLGVDESSLGKTYVNVIKKVDKGEQRSASTAEMFEVVGQFLKCLGLLSQAAPLFQQALEIRETVLDPDHPLVAQSLHHLAELFAQWGKFSAAEAFFKHAIEIKENTLGPDHPALVKDLEGLAILYKKHDKHNMADSLRKKAEGIKQKATSNVGLSELKKRTLQVEELAGGVPSAELARSLNELGVLYFLQNDHDTARNFFERSLGMREAIQGSNHPDVAQSLHNLAAFYNDQKMYDKAEPLYEKAYEIRLKAFPPHHASVASTIKHLAVLYRKQGKYASAEPLYRQALEIREKAFGKKHPSVATALNNLAVVLCLQERQSDALPLYERALAIYEEVLGGTHPRVAETLINLAKLSYDMGSPEKAAQLYKRANDIKENETKNGVCRRSSFGVLSSYSGHAPNVRQNALIPPQARDSVSGMIVL